MTGKMTDDSSANSNLKYGYRVVDIVEVGGVSSCPAIGVSEVQGSGATVLPVTSHSSH